jgi:hypothetical protein
VVNNIFAHEAIMNQKLPLKLKVASPCPAKWEEMDGDERKRFCHQCKLHVYNLSEMHESEIRELLACDDRVCGRFYQRADGTVLTADCSVGLARIRNRYLRAAAYATAASLLLVCTTAIAAMNLRNDDERGGTLCSMSRKLHQWIGPSRLIMGDIAPPPKSKL